jgi:hypothetical protein
METFAEVSSCAQTGNLSFVGADPCVRPQVGRPRGCAPTDRKLFLTSMRATWYKSPFPKGGLENPPFEKGGQGGFAFSGVKHLGFMDV